MPPTTTRRSLALSAHGSSPPRRVPLARALPLPLSRSLLLLLSLADYILIRLSYISGSRSSSEFSRNKINLYLPSLFFFHIFSRSLSAPLSYYTLLRVYVQLSIHLVSFNIRFFLRFSRVLYPVGGFYFAASNMLFIFLSAILKYNET